MAVQTVTGEVDAPHWESFVVRSVPPISSGLKSLMRNPILASNTAGYVEVTNCSDGSVCCGRSNSSCCGDGQGFNINANGQLQGSRVTPTAASSTTASSATASSATASSTTASSTTVSSTRASSIPSVRPPSSQSSANNESESSDNLSKKQVLAIGVALPTVAAVIALVAWRWPRRPQ